MRIRIDKIKHKELFLVVVHDDNGEIVQITQKTDDELLCIFADDRIGIENNIEIVV